MRIGTKLILAYLVALVLVGGALGVGLPSLTRWILVRQTADLMVQQAELVTRRLGAGGREALAARSTATLLDADMYVVDLYMEEVLVIRRDGRFVVAPRASLHPEVAGFLREVIATGQADGRVLTHAGIPELEPQGDYFIVAAAPRVRERQVVGAIMLARPVAEATRELRRVSAQILFWTLLGLVLAALLSYLVARTITRRIGEMNRAAHALAEGDLTQRVPAEGADEIGDLARAFNHMATRIEALVDGLRQSERLRRDLMASIAHELRTPITSICGFAEALKDGLVPTERRDRCYAIIHGEATRLTRLIQDLFDLAKLEAGQLEMRLQPMDLATWLPEFAEAQRPRLEQAGVGLAVQVPAGAAAPILGDQDRLEQVVHNLLDNAARYSPAGAPVQVGLERVPGGVRVYVRDAGPGVPPEEAAHLWERFYQGKDPGKRKGGAGLGLAIVRSIVQAHGGRVGLDSAPGQGACFWFELPLRPAE